MKTKADNSISATMVDQAYLRSSVRLHKEFFEKRQGSPEGRFGRWRLGFYDRKGKPHHKFDHAFLFGSYAKVAMKALEIAKENGMWAVSLMEGPAAARLAFPTEQGQATCV